MSLTVDTSKLKEAFQKFDFESRQQVGKIIREQGRGLAMELMRKTSPTTFDDDKKVFKEMSEKVEAQIRRVYKPIPVAVKAIGEMSGRSGKRRTQNMRQAARVFGSLARGLNSIRGKSAKSASRRFAAAETATGFLERIAKKPFIGTEVGPFDGGQSHKKARYGKFAKVFPNQYVKLVVTKSQPLDSYVKRKLSLIGLTKSGWVQAARQLGGDHPFRKEGGSVSAPAWVKRHRKSTGRAIDKSMDPRNPYITVTNNVPWIGALLTKYNINDTLFYRRIALLKRLGYVLRQSAKKTGF